MGGIEAQEEEEASVSQAIMWSKVTAKVEEFLRSLMEKELRQAIEASKSDSQLAVAATESHGHPREDSVACVPPEGALEEELSAALELSATMELPDAVATLASFLSAVQLSMAQLATPERE